MELTIEDIVIRLILAIIIGGIIGLERDYKNSAAGFRTNILVCIGATLVSLIQLKMANQAMSIITLSPELADVIKVDFARLGSQVITGVGFLGAGTIIYTKGTIRGLTTAASLWVVACLGLAIGMGYYELSIISAIFIVITLVILKKFQNKFISKMRKREIEIQYQRDKGIFEFIESTFAKNAIRIDHIEFVHEDEDENNNLIAVYSVSIPKFVETKELINNLSVNDGITSVISR